MESLARERQVKLAEELLGIKFPKSYRASLLKNSIGVVNSDLSTWEVFALPGDAKSRQEGRVHKDLVTGNEGARRWHNFPKGATAIAGNDCGDYLILLPSGDDSKELSDCVHYWWHATGDVILLSETAENTPVFNEGAIWNGTHNIVAFHAKNQELLHESHVDVAEHILNVRFPAIYRELLFSDKCREHCTRWCLFPELKPLDPESDELVEDGLALIHFIEKMTSEAIERWEEFPKDGLVIAKNESGDVLVLQPTDLNSDGIIEFIEAFYIFDHREVSLYPLAETLDEYFEICSEDLYV